MQDVQDGPRPPQLLDRPHAREKTRRLGGGRCHLPVQVQGGQTYACCLRLHTVRVEETPGHLIR